MDGNGRWAQARGLPRIEGHRQGVESLRATIEESSSWGIQCVSAFAFSTENWHRPEREVQGLMDLLCEFSRTEADNLAGHGIRVTPVGNLKQLPASSRRELLALADRTKGGQKMDLLLAVNYGGRQELVSAASEIAGLAAQGSISPDDVDEGLLRSHLYTANFPDPDLIIRSGGEWRLSNFYLFQAAYAELFVTRVLWPDFGADELRRAIKEFQRRDRRFGRV